MARQDLTGWGDTHIPPRPPTHAGFGFVRKVVHFDKGNLHRPLILGPGLAHARLCALVLRPGRQQHTPVFQRPGVVLRIGQFQPLGAQLSRLRDQFWHMLNIEPIENHV